MRKRRCIELKKYMHKFGFYSLEYWEAALVQADELAVLVLVDALRSSGYNVELETLQEVLEIITESNIAILYNGHPIFLV